MVPTALPHPDLIVTITGILELLGAAGLLAPGDRTGGGGVSGSTVDRDVSCERACGS